MAAERLNRAAEYFNRVAEDCNRAAEDCNRVAERCNRVAENCNRVAERFNVMAERINVMVELWMGTILNKESTTQLRIVLCFSFHLLRIDNCILSMHSIKYLSYKTVNIHSYSSSSNSNMFPTGVSK